MTERKSNPIICPGIYWTLHYPQNVDRIRGKHEIDLVVDPPPDLIIEVEMTSPVLDKLSIYARLGIPEIWRYDGRDAKILRLTGDRYDETCQSRVLSPLTQAMLSEFLRQSKDTTLAWRRMLRDWAREQKPRAAP